jgi:hypothetical protein
LLPGAAACVCSSCSLGVRRIHGCLGHPVIPAKSYRRLPGQPLTNLFLID